MLEFAPLSEFAAVLLSEKTTAAAGQLVRAVGFSATHRAIECLVQQGLISTDCAAHLILDLMSDLTILGADISAELSGGEAPPALRAVFSQTEIRVTADASVEDPPEALVEDPREQLRQIKTGVDKRAKTPPSPRKAKTPAAEVAEHTCPVCGEPISIKAIGCVKHWRQVKRGRQPGWRDGRTPAPNGEHDDQETDKVEPDRSPEG